MLHAGVAAFLQACNHEAYFTPTWGEIKDKATMYQTAQLKATGEYVKIIGVRKFLDGAELVEPCFAVRVLGFPGIGHYLTGELCNFTL